MSTKTPKHRELVREMAFQGLYLNRSIEHYAQLLADSEARAVEAAVAAIIEKNAPEIAKANAELARLRAQNDQFSDNLSAVGKAYNAEKDRAEKAEAEVERLKGMRTAAEAIMTDVAEANEELAIARAEKAEAEAQLWHNRFASILWSGALNKHTGGDFQKWEAEFKAEQNALIARAEKAEMLLKQSPHWDTVAIIQNRDNYKEDAEKAEKQFKILNETMQHVTVLYDNAITRAEKAEAEVERLTKENNAAHAALNDSVGHFVYEAAIARAEKAEAALAEVESQTSATLLKMQQRNADLRAEVERLKELLRIESASAQHALASAERAEASLHDLNLDLSTANHMIKLERDRADALQTRLKEIESALRKFNLID